MSPRPAPVKAGVRAIGRARQSRTSRMDNVSCDLERWVGDGHKSIVKVSPQSWTTADWR